MKLLPLISALACLIALSGCSRNNTPLTGVYVITEIDGVATNPAEPILVVYKDDKLVGQGPINRWTTPVLEDGKFGIVIATRMAGAPELMELENKLLQALEGGRLKANARHGLAIVNDGREAVLLAPTNSDASELMD